MDGVRDGVGDGVGDGMTLTREVWRGHDTLGVVFDGSKGAHLRLIPALSGVKPARVSPWGTRPIVMQ